jgi:hypothetical protein
MFNVEIASNFSLIHVKTSTGSSVFQTKSIQR